MKWHTHDDVLVLTFGCEACIGIVKRDQFEQSIADLDTEDLMDIVDDADWLPGWKVDIADAELKRRWATPNGPRLL